MNKIKTLLSIKFILSFCAVNSQELNLDSLCIKFNKNVIDSTENMVFRGRKYAEIFYSKIYKLSRSEQDSLTHILDSICPQTTKARIEFMKGRLIKNQINPLSFEKFPEGKKKKGWSKSKTKQEFDRLFSQLKDEKKTNDVIHYISHYISFEEFNNLTDFQKGRLTIRVVKFYESKKK